MPSAENLTPNLITADQWRAIEQIVRRDPGGRNVAAFQEKGLPLGTGQLRAAAESLARRGTRVAIVTGFCIADANPPAAETDGPPGALFLARALLDLGVAVNVVSDRYGIPLLHAGCRAWSLPDDLLVEMPLADDASTSKWVARFFRTSAAPALSHLIAIERVGPSHDLASIERQNPPREVVELFERDVPAEDRNVCHNMRGRNIDAFTAPTHRLFEYVAENRLPITTIGIGDGGNEIGMGSFRWDVVRRAIGNEQAGRIACRVATDHTIVAGVSNWGSYALALAVCRLSERNHLAARYTSESQRHLIEAIVAEAGAVDGVTKRREATVDGIPLAQYLAVLEDLLGILLDFQRGNSPEASL